MQKLTHPPDLSAVTYLSSGKTLIATLWLTHPFVNPPIKAKSWLLPNFKDAPWYIITYSMSIAVQSPYDTEGTDYNIRYVWDALSNTWTRTVLEESPNGIFKTLNATDVHPDFSLKNLSYIDLPLDLGELNYPDHYSLLFYASDIFIKGGRECRLADITNRVYVPPPEFTLSVSPSSLNLRPGQDANILVEAKTNTNVKSQASLFTNHTDEINDKIKISFAGDKLSIPSSGEATSGLNVKTLDNAKPNSTYVLPIYANMSISTKAIPRITGESVENSAPQIIPQRSNLTITLLPSLTILDYFSSALKDISQIKGLVELIAAIASIGGVTTLAKWILKKTRKEEKKEQNKFDTGWP